MSKIDMWVDRRTISVLDKILRRIAENPGINAYQIARISPRLNRVTVMRYLRKYRFVEQGLLSVQKGKRNAQCYFLNLTGILFVLQREFASTEMGKWNHAFIRKFIKKYEDCFPLVFGKWSFFRKMGVEKIALLRLKAIVDNLNVSETHIMDLFGYGGLLVPLADIGTTVEWLFFLLGVFPADIEFEDWQIWYQIRADTEAWIRALKEDKDIQAYFIQEFEYYQERLRNLGAIVEGHITRVIGTGNIRKVEGGG